MRGVLRHKKLPRKASSATAASSHGPGICFTPAILAIDIASGSGRKRNRVRRAALGAGDVVAGSVILPAAAIASLILKNHEIKLVGISFLARRNISC